MGGGELKWCQLTHTQLMSPQGPHISAHSTAKINDKAQISGRIASIGISDVVTASILGENPSEVMAELQNIGTCRQRT